MKIQVLAIRYQRRLAAPLMASVVTAVAALFGQTLQETVDRLPPGTVPEIRTTGNAAYGGRPVQVCFSLVRRVTPPTPAVDVRYNWPPVPGVHLRVRVGVVGSDGRFVADSGAGYASARTGVTNGDGIVQVDYIPPQEAPSEAANSGNPVVLWFEDLQGPIAATEIRLWKRDPAGLKPPPRLAGAPPQPARWAYGNSIDGEPFAGYFDRAAEAWNKALSLRQPTGPQNYLVKTSNPISLANLAVDARYPRQPDERIRSAFAVTEISRAGQASIRLHLEYLSPNRQFRPFNAGGVTGLENIGRSFEPTLPLDAVFGTMTHELGHVLGLADTVDPESQGSVMNQGRGRLTGNNFRFFVNEVFTPTEVDTRAALELRERQPRSLSSLPAHPSWEFPSVAAAATAGAAIAPPISGGLRYLSGSSLLRRIRVAGESQPRVAAPGGVPAWRGTAWDTGGAVDFSIWPELDLVRVEAGPMAGESFRAPGVGRQVLLAARAGSSLVRKPTGRRRFLCEYPSPGAHCTLASLRMVALRAIYGEVAGFVVQQDDRAPIVLFRVIRSLWEHQDQSPTYVRVRWPVGTADYAGTDFPSPKLGDRLILFTCPEIGAGTNGKGRWTDVEQIAISLPFGAVAVRNGYTLPLTWLRASDDNRVRKMSMSSFAHAPRSRTELFGARLSELLEALEEFREPTSTGSLKPVRAGFRLPVGF